MLHTDMLLVCTGEHEHGHDHVHEGRVQVEQTAVDREGQDAGKSRLLSAIIRVRTKLHVSCTVSALCGALSQAWTSTAVALVLTAADHIAPPAFLCLLGSNCVEGSTWLSQG